MRVSIGDQGRVRRRGEADTLTLTPGRRGEGGGWREM